MAYNPIRNRRCIVLVPLLLFFVVVIVISIGFCCDVMWMIIMTYCRYPPILMARILGIFLCTTKSRRIRKILLNDIRKLYMYDSLVKNLLYYFFCAKNIVGTYAYHIRVKNRKVALRFFYAKSRTNFTHFD